MLIKALCTGTCSLGKADVLTFCAMLRSSNAPLTIKEVDTGRDLYLTINTLESSLSFGTNVCGFHG